MRIINSTTPERFWNLAASNLSSISESRWLWQTETPAMRSCHVAGGTVIFVFSYFSAAM